MVSRLFPRNPSIHHRTTIPPPGLASRVGAYREITGRPMDNHAWLGRHAFRESRACASLVARRQSAARDPGCVKTPRGMTAPAILRLVVTFSAKNRKEETPRAHSALMPAALMIGHHLSI